MKDASDVDYIPIVAAPVKDEMARIVYDAIARSRLKRIWYVRAPFIMISDLSMEP